jgi:hypothetical protein
VFASRDTGRVFRPPRRKTGQVFSRRPLEGEEGSGMVRPIGRPMARKTVTLEDKLPWPGLRSAPLASVMKMSEGRPPRVANFRQSGRSSDSAAIRRSSDRRDPTFGSGARNGVGFESPLAHRFSPGSIVCACLRRCSLCARTAAWPNLVCETYGPQQPGAILVPRGASSAANPCHRRNDLLEAI